MNPKDFMLKWIEGLHNLNPTQILHAKMTGHIGGVFGLFFAMYFMFYTSAWYFFIFILAMTFLQYLEFISTRQQWLKSCEMMDMIKVQKEKIKQLLEEDKNERKTSSVKRAKTIIAE